MTLHSSTERAFSQPQGRVEAIGEGRRPVRHRQTLARIAIPGATVLLLSALVPVALLDAQPAPEAPARGAPVPSVREGRDGVSEALTTRPAGVAGPGRTGSAGPRFGGRTGFTGTGGVAMAGPGGIGGSMGSGMGTGGMAAPSTPTMGDGPTSKLDATLYDVRMPPAQIGKLDVDALTEASATPDAFEKALAALGTVQPLYRASQSVRLSGDTITIGSEVPVVTSSHVSEKGQTMNSISYMSTGAVFNLAGSAGAGGIDLDLGIQLSSISDGNANISDNVKAAVMRKATLSHKGPVQPRKPFLVVSVDAGSTDKDGKAVAYIGRITLGELRPPVQAAPSAPR